MTSTRVFHLKVQSLFKRQSIVFLEYIRQSIVFSSIFDLDRSLWEQKVAKESENVWQLLVGNYRHFLCTVVMGRGKFCARN